MAVTTCCCANAWLWHRGYCGWECWDALMLGGHRKHQWGRWLSWSYRQSWHGTIPTTSAKSIKIPCAIFMVGIADGIKAKRWKLMDWWWLLVNHPLGPPQFWFPEHQGTKQTTVITGPPWVELYMLYIQKHYCLIGWAMLSPVTGPWFCHDSFIPRIGDNPSPQQSCTRPIIGWGKIPPTDDQLTLIIVFSGWKKI